MNEPDSIAEIGIDEQERIYVRPSRATFPYIYREAVEIHWEPVRRNLHSPKPREPLIKELDTRQSLVRNDFNGRFGEQLRC